MFSFMCVYMVFQGVAWTIIADGMSSAEVEIAKVTLMIRVKILEYDDSIDVILFV